MTEAWFDFFEAIINENWCPYCLGELDTGFECNDCGQYAGNFSGLDETEIKA